MSLTTVALGLRYALYLGTLVAIYRGSALALVAALVLVTVNLEMLGPVTIATSQRLRDLEARVTELARERDKPS